MDMRVAAYAVIVDDADRVLLARWTEGRRVSWADALASDSARDSGGQPVRQAPPPVSSRVRVLTGAGELLAVAPAGAGDEPVRTLRVFRTGAHLDDRAPPVGPPPVADKLS